MIELLYTFRYLIVHNGKMVLWMTSAGTRTFGECMLEIAVARGFCVCVVDQSNWHMILRLTWSGRA